MMNEENRINYLNIQDNNYDYADRVIIIFYKKTILWMINH